MSDTIALIGGQPLQVSLRDGTTENVLVRELPIRLIPRFLELQDDEAVLVELYCDKPEGWDDSLVPESHEEVVRIGGELNFPIADRWLARKRDMVEKLMPSISRVTALQGTLPISAPATESAGQMPSS